MLEYRQTSPGHFLVTNKADNGKVVAHIYNENEEWRIYNMFVQTSYPVMDRRFVSQSRILGFAKAWDFLITQSIGVSRYYQGR